MSYSLISGIGEMVDFEHWDNLDISKSPPKFIQKFKNKYYDDVQRIKQTRVQEQELKEKLIGEKG